MKFLTCNHVSQLVTLKILNEEFHILQNIDVTAAINTLEHVQKLSR